jgi:hypothetical protein
VPDGAIARQLREDRLAEAVLHEAHRAVREERPPSLDTMPALSWPRCCSACRPRYARFAASFAPQIAEHAALVVEVIVELPVVGLFDHEDLHSFARTRGAACSASVFARPEAPQTDLAGLGAKRQPNPSARSIIQNVASRPMSTEPPFTT